MRPSLSQETFEIFDASRSFAEATPHVKKLYFIIVSIDRKFIADKPLRHWFAIQFVFKRKKNIAETDLWGTPAVIFIT